MAREPLSWYELTDHGLIIWRDSTSYSWHMTSFDILFCRSFWAIQPWSSRDDRPPETTVLAWTASLPATRDTTGWQFPTIPSPTKSYCPSQKQGAPHQCNCKRWQRLVCEKDILQWVFFLIIINILCLFHFFSKLHTSRPHEMNITIYSHYCVIPNVCLFNKYFFLQMQSTRHSDKAQNIMKILIFNEHLFRK